MANMMGTDTKPRGTCPVCGNGDVLIKKNGRLRKHFRVTNWEVDITRPCPAEDAEPYDG
jgi:hypothetical protein